MLLKFRNQWWVGALVGVFFLGCVIGARYLSNVEIGKVFLGFLPPYRSNTAANYHQLTKGMSKGQVVDLLSIGRTNVIAGDQLAADGGVSVHAHPLRGGDLARTVEVWHIPSRTMGITSYVYLAFDKEQCLVCCGVSEFMSGFPADREIQ